MRGAYVKEKRLSRSRGRIHQWVIIYVLWPTPSDVQRLVICEIYGGPKKKDTLGICATKVLIVSSYYLISANTDDLKFTQRINVGHIQG